ncbi:uncharacterized protein LOC135836076 [Planococcus citri]|uniref:uncharacterized protein LOC135836076 n=1 Tax=Planococcus citri TaxID=170843 RepID=UPI0031F7B323
MRKYQQLLLLIISIVCIVTLLFYRHEYLKLRSVLSVLDFFGSAAISNSSCLIFSNNLTKDITSKYQFSEPRSVWKTLNNHFVFSSVWEDHDDGGFIRTLVIGPKSAFYDYECRVWFEVGDIIVSEQGLVKYELDARSLNNTRANKYFLKCFVQDKPSYGVPYGVLWYTSHSNNSVFSPMFRKPKSQLLETAVCVLPDYSGLAKTNIMEFIAFYNTIGVSDFIIYDSGIQHSVFPFLESASGRNGIVSSVSVIQWNFPMINPAIERLAIEDDCLSRTLGKVKFVAIVSWDDYIIPKKRKLDQIVSPNNIVDLLHLSMKRRLCCTNLPDDKSTSSAWPLFLRKRQCVEDSNVDNMLYVNFKSYGSMNKNRIYEISEDLAVINRYVLCDETLQRRAKPTPVSDYYSRVNTHKLLTLWKSHLNTTSIFN